MGLGLHEAARELRAPFGGFRPAPSSAGPTRASRAGLGARSRAAFRRGARLPERWERELLPRVRAINAELEALRPERPAPEEAQQELDRLWELVREEWRLHFLAVVPAQAAAEVLHDRHVELFGDEDPLAPYRLLEGIENPADEALAALAGRAPGARRRRRAARARSRACTGAIARQRPGRRFLHELDGYLLRYGGRSRWHELSLPREAELPALTLEALWLRLEGDGARRAPCRSRRPSWPS